MRRIEEGVTRRHEPVSDDNDGVVEEVHHDIDDNGAGTNIKVAEKGAEDEAREEGKDLTMAEAEDSGGDPDGDVDTRHRETTRKPALEEVLDAGAEEDFLAEGGNECDDEEVGGKGTHAADGQEIGHQCLGLLAYGTEGTLERLEDSAPVPVVVPNGGLVDEGGEEQKNDDSGKTEEPP